jgi:ketosteroid isomerase-like protein
MAEHNKGGAALSNLEIVQLLYTAFKNRDNNTVLEILDPDIEWIQNEGFPDGGKHVGANTVLGDVFAKFRSQWESWQAVVDEWIDAGDIIIALGEYRGTFKSTGKSMRSAFAHVYRLKNEKIIRFQQYTDTLKIAEVMK